MSEYTEEEEFIALADGRRKVASPEGAKFYGQPIGTWITPDMIKAKKAEKGEAPKGALETGKSLKNVSTTDTGSSVSGPNKFKVGEAQFSAPKGSILIKSKNSSLTYIRTPDGEIHAYNGEGEKEIPAGLKALLKGKFSQNFKGDDLYDIEEFDESGDDQKLSDLPLGTQLTKNGIVAFEKKEEKLWENPDLGIQLTDADLQSAFDQGQFEVVAPTTEELDFSKLSEDELTGVLESFPSGKKLFFGNTTLVKQDNDAWKSMTTGKDTDSAVLAGIAANTNFLGEKKPVQADDGEDPLETATPEPVVVAPKVYDASENLVDSEEIWSAEAGDSVFHKTKGELVKAQSGYGDYWQASDGYTYLSGLVAQSAERGNISFVAWDEEQEKALDPDPVVSDEVWTLLAQQKKIQAIKQYREDNDLVSLKEAKDVIDGLWNNEQDKIATYAPKPKVDKSKILNEYDLSNAIPGTTVKHDSEGILTLEDDGAWYNEYSEPIFEPADILNENDEGKLSNLQSNDVEEDDDFNPEIASLQADIPDNVNAVSTLDYMDTDDEIVVSTLEGQITFTKQYDGEWFDGKSSWFSDEDLFEDVDNGLVYQLKEDEPAPAPEPVKTPEPTEETETEPDTGLSKADTQSAIESLEAHSGFQIKYGLKSLPDDHPLKQQDTLDKVVAEAKEANANLSPKQALVKYLKDSIKTNNSDSEPLADWEKELLEGPYIQIGSTDAKNTATGITGGSYSKEEIQKAVDLLEGFEGKAFKAYLNKNGNKLGELSPNDIVGFNKDKTITKNNFVALLKKKLADAPSGWDEPKKADIPEPVADDLQEDDAPSLEDIDPATLSKNQISNLPAGTKVYQGGEEYEKNDENGWKTEGNQFVFTSGEMRAMFVSDGDWSFKKPANSQENSSDNASVPDADTVDSPEVTTSEETNVKQPVVENGHTLISDPSAKKIGGQAGSNEGGLYNLETVNGYEDFYVKKAQSEDHGKNEALANALYAKLGVNAPEVDLASDGNLYSKIVKGEQDMADRLDDKEWLDKVQKDYVIDAWLSNRDVFGLVYDNILTDENGTPWRIDNGGALTYRAMGAKKTDFGNEVTELDIFKTGKKAKVFGSDVMPVENELDGAKRLRDLSPDSIRDMVSQYGLDDELANKLIARREYILDRYDLNDADAPEVSTEQSFNSGDTITSVEEFNNLPVGSKIQYEAFSGPIEYTKLDDSKWQKAGTTGSISAYNFDSAIGDGKVKFLSSPNGVQEQSANTEYKTGDKLLNVEKFKSLPVGTVVQYKTQYMDDTYTKIDNNKWQVNGPTPSQISDYAFYGAIEAGYLYYGKQPKPVVDVSAFNKGDSITSQDQINALPAGTKLNFDVSGYGTQWLVKQEDGMWQDAATGTKINKDLTSILPMLTFESMPGQSNAPVVEETLEPVNGIAPGKYNTGKGAKAHLWVKADGTGLYQGMKGIQKPLDADGVKKNYDAGMNVLATSDLSEMPGGPESASPDAAKKMIPYLGTVDTLPDGSYQDTSGTEYVVSGKNVTIMKEKKSMDFSPIKVGQKPDSDFANGAPDGTRIAYYHSGFSAGKKPSGFVVKKDGEWVLEEGSPEYVMSYVAGFNAATYYNKRWRVASLPEKSSKSATKASIKTKYLQGELVDTETRNSVFPPGHTGTVTYAGGLTNVASLDAWRDFMKNPNNSVQSKAAAHSTFGVPLDPVFLKKRLLEKKGADNFSAEEFIDAINEDVDEFLATANIPEKQNPLDLFKKDSFGNPKKPLFLAMDNLPSYYSSAKEHSDAVKEIASFVGDGTVIGQGMIGATKDDKQYWVNAVKNGNFKYAYDLEVKVAKEKGKPYTPNPMHPGHPLNPDTHQIQWGAAVEGEVPAGQVVPGSWSSLEATASLPEIDNYLILAKMQNPTHLTNSEKRNWVLYHRQANSYGTDKLSAVAQDRANKNLPPQTEAPVWTDDVKPAKAWEVMFDGTDFPQTWDTYSSKGWEYYNDHKDETPGMVEAWNAKKAENSYYDNDDVSALMLNEWFAAREAEYLEELNKPVYKVVQQISTGTHPVYIIADQFDRKKIFKPLTPGKEWRSENEVAAHNLAAQLGFNVPNAKIGNVYEGLPMGSNYQGIIMDFAPNIGSFGDIDGAALDFSTLTEKQVGQLAGEHVLDWFLDNDDTHSENILVGEAGEIVAIDKGRAFFQYGHWHGLNADKPELLNINTQDSDGKANVYYDMMQAVSNGTFSQAQIDAAYKASVRAAKRINKFDDNAVELFVRSATDKRNTWEVPDYAQNWDVVSAAPQSQDELVAAVLARKSAILTDVEDMWSKLYAKSGFEKPEAPAKLINEELSSGWEEADLAAKVEESKVWGVAPVHASAAFMGGSSLIWTEKNTNNESLVSGKFTLGSLSQKKALEFLNSKVKPGNGYMPTAELKDYPASHVKQWKKTTTAAGKNVSANATTGDYDNEIIQTMRDTEKLVDADIAFAPQVDTYSKDMVTFPSGVSMPGETVPQYLMALDHHKGLVKNVETAIKEQVATDKNHFKDFQPPQWKINGAKYSGPEGVSYKELDGGNYVEVKNGVAAIVPDIPAAAKTGAPGWTKEGADPAEVSLDPDKYSYNQAGMFAGKLLDNGDKQIESVFSSSGHPGYEYRIDLASGEKVFFRNGESTDTITSQRGTVRFTLSSNLDTETSLANVQNYLEKWGLDMSGADEDQAESVYWRQMFRRVIDSNTTNASKGVQAARKKLIDMKKELQQSTGFYNMANGDIPEAIGLSNPEGEASFWRSLAYEAYGADKVNSWLAEGSHLPQYQHMDLTDPEKKTGLPFYNRIDVDLKELYAKGHMVAIGNNGKDDRHFDYIKSGGMVSTEERLRILGYYKTGASSSDDQDSGGANSVFTRIANGGALTSGAIYGAHRAYWSPKVFQHTGTYSFSSDMFGRLTNQEEHNAYNPFDSLKYTASGNETMVSNTLSIADYLELMVFDDEKKRLKAIEEMKKLGYAILRGLPIEDRLINRNNLDKAIQKIRESWK